MQNAPEVPPDINGASPANRSSIPEDPNSDRPESATFDNEVNDSETARFLNEKLVNENESNLNRENAEVTGTDEPTGMVEPARTDEPAQSETPATSEERVHVTGDLSTAGSPTPDENEKPPIEISVDKLTTAANEATPEILRVRGMKFMYPSGSKPLEGYTLKRGIGIGGFGEVYFALSDAGKEVALKRIQRNLDIELRGVRQCLNLKHSNLISLWDIRTSSAGECWVVMEYVPGISLRDAINDHPDGVPMDEVDRWFSATAAGVAYLHERGIVHRDLKPGNIFQDDEEQLIKIGDYGLSKFISTSQRDNQTESVGTFHYMAPEIGKGVYGKEVDIYALGIILHEMLTGSVPFDGESSQEIIMKHLTADPDVDQVPARMRPVIRRALAKDPNKRYSSVEELVSDLDFKHIPTSLHRRVKELHSQAGRRVPPIEPMLISGAAEPVQTESSEPFYIGDDIQFNDMREVVDAESVVGFPDPPLKVETVEVYEPEAIVTHQVADEPIAKAVRGGMDGFSGWWNNANVSTPLKVVVLGAVVLALIASRELLLPLTLGLGLIYLIYFLIRLAFIQPSEKSTSAYNPPKSQDPGLSVPGNTALSKTEQIAQLRNHIGKRKWSEKAAELSGSLVVAALACAIFALLGLAVGGNLIEPTAETWAFYGWLVVTSVLASWGILIVNKSWEHRKGEATVRRFAMLTLGLGIGFASFFIAQAINLNWANQSSFDMTDNISPFDQLTFSPAGAPRLLGQLAFFASLFLLLRWWKHADPVRRTRFNILSIGICVIWAVIIGQLFFFPQPWAMILTVVISASTQIASPWLHPGKRQEFIYGEQLVK